MTNCLVTTDMALAGGSLQGTADFMLRCSSAQLVNNATVPAGSEQVLPDSGLASGDGQVSSDINVTHRQVIVKNIPTDLTLDVQSIGVEAHRIMQQSSKGKLLAVFSRSAYVHNEHGVFCVGMSSIGQGPLQVQLVSDSDDIFSVMAAGSLVNLCCLSQPDSYGCGADQIYCGTVSVLLDGHRQLADSAKERLLAFGAPPSEHGFAWLLSQQTWCESEGGHDLAEVSSPGLDVFDRELRRQSVGAIQSLLGWLQACLASSQKQAAIEPEQEVVALLGAGPGLTPAGDDLLAGVMLALHRIRRGDTASLLWQVLEPFMSERTNIISSAHLRLAAQSQCAEPMQQLLNNFISAASPAVSASLSLSTLADAIGGSSGWDTLAGMSLVVRAIPNSRED